MRRIHERKINDWEGRSGGGIEFNEEGGASRNRLQESDLEECIVDLAKPHAEVAIRKVRLPSQLKRFGDQELGSISILRMQRAEKKISLGRRRR